MCKLPKPRYCPDASDPSWLGFAVQFHGHLGPWAMAGARLGSAGRAAVGAAGYFDLEVTVEGPLARTPEACFLDGLQVATGATMGKRNLCWTEKDEIVVRFKNTHTGKQADVHPTALLLELISALRGQSIAETKPIEAPNGDRSEDSAEQIARKIAAAPDDEILEVRIADW